MAHRPVAEVGQMLRIAWGAFMPSRFGKRWYVSRDDDVTITVFVSLSNQSLNEFSGLVAEPSERKRKFVLAFPIFSSRTSSKPLGRNLERPPSSRSSDHGGRNHRRCWLICHRAGKGLVVSPPSRNAAKTHRRWRAARRRRTRCAHIHRAMGVSLGVRSRLSNPRHRSKRPP